MDKVKKLEAENEALKEKLLYSQPNSMFTWQRRWGMIVPEHLDHIMKIEAENEALKNELKFSRLNKDKKIRELSILADERKYQNRDLKKQVKEARQECIEEINELAPDGVFPNELERARNWILDRLTKGKENKNVVKDYMGRL